MPRNESLLVDTCDFAEWIKRLLDPQDVMDLRMIVRVIITAKSSSAAELFMIRAGMASARHVQQQMVFRTHGGRRRNAGRPPKRAHSSEPHKRRAGHDPRHPTHVTIRVTPEVGTLRCRDAFRAIRWATLTTARRDDFRIIHLSVQRTHLHLLIEARSRLALSRGMQGFQISAAKHLNAAIGARTGTKRTGGVFSDRFHARALTSPRAVRHALAYVLNNWRRHGEDRAAFANTWNVDPYSTAIDFPEWKELGDSPFLYEPPQTYDALIVWRPNTWLLRDGWRRHGRISIHEIPGGARTEARG